MVAAQAVVKKSASTTALEISERMKELAATGEWNRIEEILVSLEAAVMDIPEDERRKTIIEVQRCASTITDQAREARQDVTGKIHELRKGQAAKKAYGLS